ncbi:hypothetical protein ACFWWT_27595 [Streptomyces sp. NPDC058676]|uniref:hypothetical protein n=1 Tax=unclassified Streptomyces TaxID=2593676 RepID=UPI003659E745
MAKAHPERSITQRTPIELFDRMLTPDRRALDVLRVEVRTGDGTEKARPRRRGLPPVARRRLRRRALLAGFLADAYGITTAIWNVAALTAVSGLIVAVRMYDTPAKALSHIQTTRRSPVSRVLPPYLRPQNGLNAAAEPTRTRLTSYVSGRIRAGQSNISRHRPTWGQTREQRIQSVQAKLTIQHPKMNVSAGQEPAQVGRVGLEPTADGL